MRSTIMSNLEGSISAIAANWRKRPRWANFNTTNSRVGIDKPDTRYLSAHLTNASGDNISRIYGNRSNKGGP